MSGITLAPFLAYPLHVAGWKRPKGSVDYRVTNTFTGPDFLNAGQHRAVDCGNFRVGDAVKAPQSCTVRARRHTDGALGLEFDLGAGLLFELWHLNRIDPPRDRWVRAAQGQVLGVTGSTGARLPNGSPMPAHTHIALTRHGVPIDPEPYLPMVERAAKPIPVEDDMDLPNGLRALVVATLGVGNRLRTDPSTADGSQIMEEQREVQLLGSGITGEPYTLGGKPGDEYMLVGVYGRAWYVARPLLTGWKLKGDGEALSSDRMVLDRIKTAAEGARQAIDAVVGLAS